ncbi:hypothetical protein TanjilG_12098 [Lupinus angustifolius]|uniref:J domain-containing protein n=1 Tax=Lupinus angustifolius TaxID=3871 RepID=A0A1J7IHU9_LUPAN|nr:PREDICTED: auxilin-related protein 2 [Lupinus angustifolius]OIW14505.1 hypothetical protein TanjilG_12098 [Lupinus angustifolius]
MDEFGVLTESFGLKPQGKSAPMASSKRSNSNPSLNPKSSLNGSRSHQNSTFDFNFNSFPSSNKNPHHFDGIDDIFGGVSAKPSNNNVGSFDFVDDIFGGMPKKNVVGVDDLLDKIGGFNVNGSKSLNQKKTPDFDELIPGFGGTTSSNHGKASTGINKPRTNVSQDDPFLIFETTSSTASTDSFLDSLEQTSKLSSSKGTKGSSSSSNIPTLRPPPKPTSVSNTNKVNNSSVSSIDELENFAMGRVQNNVSRKANINTSEIKQNSAANTNSGKGSSAARVNKSNDMGDLESFFSMGARSSSVPKSRAAPMDHMFDHQVNNKVRSEASQSVPSGSSTNVKKSSVSTSLDDLSLIFGGSPSSEFKEVEGENEERRKARLGRHQRTQERALKAVADMNQRDLQTKMEQEERRRIADIADAQIKRWAAGKEGNMRALLSTLQNVLWPECGWQPVSLTDMITSTSVKKVYRKATLCIHPDKVQQKGASLEQKYTAEKVFDILKEAWTKFNKEELS